jgi:hypothetical protein
MYACPPNDFLFVVCCGAVWIGFPMAVLALGLWRTLAWERRDHARAERRILTPEAQAAERERLKPIMQAWRERARAMEEA